MDRFPALIDALNRAMRDSPSEVHRSMRRLLFALAPGQKYCIPGVDDKQKSIDDINYERHLGKLRLAAKDIATIEFARGCRSDDLYAYMSFTRIRCDHDIICRELALFDFFITPWDDYIRANPLEICKPLPKQFHIIRGYLIGAAWNIKGLYENIFDHIVSEPLIIHPRKYGTCTATVSEFLWIGLGFKHMISEVNSRDVITIEATTLGFPG